MNRKEAGVTRSNGCPCFCIFQFYYLFEFSWQKIVNLETTGSQPQRLLQSMQPSQIQEPYSRRMYVIKNKKCNKKATNAALFGDVWYIISFGKSCAIVALTKTKTFSLCREAVPCYDNGKTFLRLFLSNLFTRLI